MAFSAAAHESSKTTMGSIFSSRAYQLEMFEESLKRNIIVVMSTGSGKTHVAALRIKKELEVALLRRIIWFLAPTVDLCRQQHRDLQSQMPLAYIKQLTSHDNVHLWRKSAWNVALINVNVVVSTHDVLHGALCHAFVAMESLALLVFDEVHNCTGNSPGSKIMRDFYHRNKRANKSVPHILGLTANAAASPKELQILESLLDSVCKSPHIQREEFFCHINQPKVERLAFKNEEESLVQLSTGLQRLRQLNTSLPISEEPQIVRLQATNTPGARYRLENALENKKTFVQRQMRSICGASERMQTELGTWAADEYISLVVQNISRSTTSGNTRLLQWEDSEKRYLADALRRIDLPPRTTPDLSTATSDKVRTLMRFLSCCSPTTTGILFAKERATVHMLFRLLSYHAGVCKLFRMGVVVGQANVPKKKREVCNFWNPEDYSESLDLFRRGKINLLIATSVLEEGIDIPQCNLVVCFDEPVCLTSYIQRRGRARMRGSRYVILFNEDSAADRRDWDGLEQIMKEECEAADRKIQELPKLETLDSSRERQFRAAGTDALLDLDSAKAHLQQFCSQLGSRYQSDMQPEYIIQKEHQVHTFDGRLLFSARVVLPASLPPNLRIAYSKEQWQSEKYATKDAALESCIALYHANLLDNHFLPLGFEKEIEESEVKDAVIDIREQFSPWPEVARAWASGEMLHEQNVVLTDEKGATLCRVEMQTALPYPKIEAFPIYWNAATEWQVEIGQPKSVEPSNLARSDTTTLLRTAYGHRWEIEDGKHVVNFVVLDMPDPSAKQSTTTSADGGDGKNISIYLLRDVEDRNRPYFQTKPSNELPECPKPPPQADIAAFSKDESYIELQPWPRRRDFLHRLPPPESEGRRRSVTLPRCRMSQDVLPAAYAQFGLLIPSIMHKVELQLVLAKLQQTLLADVPIARPDLLLTAICAPSAHERDNYQVLEFFGDSVLKFITSVFLMSKFIHLPEGYLSRKRALIVSNKRLCDAALASGLDAFILTKPFTGKSWRPFYVDSLRRTDVNSEVETRKVARKTVADVIESLIGAGWKMGYFEALSIAKVFLPEIDIPSLDTARLQLIAAEPVDGSSSDTLRLLQQLIGYSFRKKSLLLQATTHCSESTSHASYERLEFLGDAILEMVVVHELEQYKDSLSPFCLHTYRQAMVNRDYLGFLALEWSIPQKRADILVDSESDRMTEVTSEHRFCLGDFLRYGSDQVGYERVAAIKRHATLRGAVMSALEAGTHYPWVLLASLRANKFFADIVESVMAAVWVDSGSLLACRQVAARMGLVNHLHRIIRDKVHVIHPTEELHIFAGGEEVGFVVQQTDVDSEDWSCSIYIKGSLVAEVMDCRTANEAKVKASERAVSVLIAAETTESPGNTVIQQRSISVPKHLPYTTI